MNSYILSRQWFDFAFENSSKVKPIHGGIYFWLIELANRLGWPAEFGNPTSQCMLACGISSYNTYKKAFDELVDFGFIDVKRKSINQHTSCVIALSIIDKAPYKALDKALSDHNTKQYSSTIQSTDSINKPINQEPSNLKPLNNNEGELLKDENSEGLEEKEKAKRKKVAPKKEKVPEHYFEDSPYYERSKFLEYFNFTKYPITEHPNTDVAYYYEQLKRWAEYGSSKSPGKKKSKDWLCNARTFFTNDIEKGKLKLKAPTNQPKTYGIKHLDPNAPDYYERLQEHYAVSKAS